MTSLFRPHLESVTYGGTFGGGSPFRNSGETEGRVLQRIRVSREVARICGIEFWLTGDSTPNVYGIVRSETSSYEFAEGERITRLEFRNHLFLGHYNVARVRFFTSRGRTFEYGSTREPTGDWFAANLGSGVCVGVAGNVGAGNALTMLGFVFLRSIQRVGFSSVEYPTISTSTITTTPILQQLPDTFKSNDDDEPLQVVLAGSRQFKTTSTWTTSSAVGLLSHLVGNNILVDISLGINTPTVVPTGPAGASTTFQWQTVRTFPSTNAIQGSIANLTVSTDEYSVWCHISDTVAPGQSLPKHAAWVGEGRITALPCSANIQVFTSGGNNLPLATFSFPVRVLYNGGAHSNVQSL